MADVLVISKNDQIIQKIEMLLSKYNIKSQTELDMKQLNNIRVIFIDTAYLNLKKIKEIIGVPYYFIITDKKNYLDLISYRPYGILFENTLCKDFNVYKKIITQYLDNYINIQNKIIFHDDIYFVVSDCHYCVIHTRFNKKIKLRIKINELFALLESEQFYQCHKSYIVNYNYIDKVAKNAFVLFNQHSIPISRSRYKGSVIWYFNYIK